MRSATSARNAGFCDSMRCHASTRAAQSPCCAAGPRAACSRARTRGARERRSISRAAGAQSARRSAACASSQWYCAISLKYGCFAISSMRASAEMALAQSFSVS
jgi:hypothetical protein